MAITPVAFRVASATDMEAALNVALAPLTNVIISGVEIDQVRSGPFADRNLYAVFNYNAAGAFPIATAFQAKVFSYADEAQVILLIDQFIAANPTYFFSESFFSYRSTSPDPDQFVFGVIFYNATAGASINWAGGGSGGGGGSTSGYGTPTAEPASRALTAFDNSHTLVCSGSPVFTVNAGMPIGFGLAAQNTCSFVAGAGVVVTDQRVAGVINPWCALVNVGLNAYAVVGGTL